MVLGDLGETSPVTKLRQQEFITEKLIQPAGFLLGQVVTKEHF